MTSAFATHRRDIQVMGVIGVAHLFSHFFQLVLAPLFPLISADLAISNVELGLLVSVFFLASAGFQTPAGFLVDRIGARPVLIGGLGVLSVSVALYGFAPNYEVMLALVFVAGIGNSVFHPADYSLLNDAVNPKLIGRAYGVHSIGGYLGFALAPLFMATLGVWLGWRDALIVAGLIGIGMAVILLGLGGAFFQGSRIKEPTTGSDSIKAGIAILMKPTILGFFVFFMLLAMASIGMQNFTPTALVMKLGLPLVAAGGAISAFLIGVPIGIMAGGVVADRYTRNQDMAASGAFIAVGLIVMSLTLFDLTGPILYAVFSTAGLLFGVALPNRDMVVRRATPDGASGRVFGFVYGGLDAGAAITPVLYGWFLDQQNPDWVFLSSSCLYFLAALLMLATARTMRRADNPTGQPS
jgi:MFS family permease